MTYARIESFRDLSGLMAQFEWYIQTHERRYSNNVMDQKYNDQNPDRKKTGIDPDAKQEAEEKACSKLSLYLFFNKKQRELKQKIFDEQYHLAKILIDKLYGNAAFFKQAEENHPDLSALLLDGMIAASENQPVKSVSDIASLDLGNAELNEVLYRILKGTVEIEKQDKEKTYPSLFKYITLKNKTKIRVYLASKNLLLAIYGDPGLVNAILDERKNLFKEIKDEEKSPAEATKEFQSQFAGKQQSDIAEDILDFTVTKTNPKSYE